MSLANCLPKHAAGVDRLQSIEDVITARGARAMAAILDCHKLDFAPGDPLPPLWHWAFCPEILPKARIGEDGHPVRGEFWPAISLPRRMNAGSHVIFLEPLRVGGTVRRDSRITGVQEKSGAMGPLVFVCVEHTYSTQGRPAIQEQQTIVYVGSTAAEGSKRPRDKIELIPHWVDQVVVDPITLFRYSAVTFNGHRIHYDRTYATEVEGYPALVVHGPLTATLLVQFLQKNDPNSAIAEFEFRALRPIFESVPIILNGYHDRENKKADLWACTQDGYPVMCATAYLRE